jgi:hypothetical protein
LHSQRHPARAISCIDISSLQRLIDTELPARAEIAATFESAGFARVTHQVVRQTIAPDWPSFVEKSALRGDSFLARLSDNEFHTGMDALQAHADGSTCPLASAKRSTGSFSFGTGRET